MSKAERKLICQFNGSIGRISTPTRRVLQTSIELVNVWHVDHHFGLFGDSLKLSKLVNITYTMDTPENSHGQKLWWLIPTSQER